VLNDRRPCRRISLVRDLARCTDFGEVAGLQLQTSFDRREFGFEWQMELPGGGDAVGWDVEVY
jgi:hypothetical protein